MHITVWASSTDPLKYKSLLVDTATPHGIIVWFESDGIKEYPVKQIYHMDILNFGLADLTGFSQDNSFVCYHTEDRLMSFNFKDEESSLLFKLKYL